MSKFSHYFKRRKALKLFADRFLFEPLRPLPQPGMVVPPAAQPQTVIKPEIPQAPLQPNGPTVLAPPQPVQPPQQPGAPIAPTQIPVQAPPDIAPVAAPQAQFTSAPPVRDQIVDVLQPMANKAKMDVINRRLQ